jgi:DNA-binding ferritin-like protein (Dps family)
MLVALNLLDKDDWEDQDVQQVSHTDWLHFVDTLTDADDEVYVNKIKCNRLFQGC